MQRSALERFVQALIYEVVAVVFLTPVYSYALNLPMDNSFVTMGMISLAVIVWAAIYNTIFDKLMFRWSGRLAHQKTQWLRILHAGLYEVTVTFIAVPIIIVMSGKSWWVALIADIGFSFIFAAYTYVFHLTYDRFRPVRAA
jgi:uncharacterized membrane protein